MSKTDSSPTITKQSFKLIFTTLRHFAYFTARRSPLLFVLKIISAIIEGTLPIFTAYVTARLTTELVKSVGNPNGLRNVIPLVLITISTLLFRNVFTSISNMIEQRIRAEIDYEMSEQMIIKFTKLDHALYEDSETMNLYERATAFASKSWSITYDASRFLSTTVSLITASIALASISLWLPLLVLVSIMPFFLLQIRYNREEDIWYRKRLPKIREVNQYTNALVSPQDIRELRLLGLVDYFRRKAKTFAEETLKMEHHFRKKNIRIDSIIQLWSTSIEAVVLVWVVKKIVEGSMAIGQFIYIQSLFQSLVYALQGEIQLLQQTDEDLLKASDYFNFINLPEVPPREYRMSSETPIEIKLENVSFTYPNTKNEVLHNISLTIRPGSIIAFVGENGAGKSTILNLILGIYRPTSGRVTINGIDLHEIDTQSWFDQIGVLPQQFTSFYYANVEDNIHFGRINKPLRSSDIDEALELSYSRDFVRKLPRNQKTMLSKFIDEGEGVDLSGGQWQRLAIARVFYRKPRFVILDEPTSAIDAKAEHGIFENLNNSILKTAGGIIVSHRFSTVRKADYIYVIDSGSVAEQGNHQELLKNQSKYFELFEKQAEGYR